MAGPSAGPGTDRDAVYPAGKTTPRAELIVRQLTFDLQYYLRESRDVLLLDNVEMGAGLAMAFAKAISPLDRQECEGIWICFPQASG